MSVPCASCIPGWTTGPESGSRRIDYFMFQTRGRLRLEIRIAPGDGKNHSFCFRLLFQEVGLERVSEYDFKNPSSMQFGDLFHEPFCVLVSGRVLGSGSRLSI